MDCFRQVGLSPPSFGEKVQNLTTYVQGFHACIVNEQIISIDIWEPRKAVLNGFRWLISS